MTNLKTKVLNCTKYEITVKEGNAGIFSKLKTLQPYNETTTKPDSCTIEVDQNATFREYWMVVPPEHQNLPKIIVTSDDCVDSKHIKISYNDSEKKFSTEKISRDKSKEPAAPKPCNTRRNAAGNGMVVNDHVNNNGDVAMGNLVGSSNPDNQLELPIPPAIPPATLPAVQEGKHGTKVKWLSKVKNIFLPNNWKAEAD